MGILEQFRLDGIAPPAELVGGHGLDAGALPTLHDRYGISTEALSGRATPLANRPPERAACFVSGEGEPRRARQFSPARSIW